MIIPIRCFTCNKVLADKWEWYDRESKKLIQNQDKRVFDMNDLNAMLEKNQSSEIPKNFENVLRGKLLDQLGLTRLCCRRHMLGHVDLIENI
jgi:DNA-directed RNA polymerase I, II, and III subunit RPABC5